MNKKNAEGRLPAHEPDRWAIIKVVPTDNRPLYRVLAGWTGAFLESDRWRINSGIVRVNDIGEELVIHGVSGSTYFCHKRLYGNTSLSWSIFQGLMAEAKSIGVTIELLDQQTALSLSWVQEASPPAGSTIEH